MYQKPTLKKYGQFRELTLFFSEQSLQCASNCSGYSA